jgi:lipopolysaccharide export system ATP-binding protein
MSKLTIKNLAKRYGKREVVKDISIEVSENEIVGLLGPNGAGKTTCFYMITGLIATERGSITINGKEISQLSMHKRSHMGLSYLPQEKSIFRNMTVEENILAILELQKEMKKTEKEEVLNELLTDFHLLHLRDVMAPKLSGGECRRVELARALATKPKILLLDEPFAGIDPISINDIKKMILKLKTRNIGVLITDHNVRETLKICDHAYVFNEGEILTKGTAKDIIAHKQVQNVYLGDEFEI